MLSRFSCVQLFETPQTIAHQAPLSMGFSRREYCSGLPCPPRDLPNSGIEPMTLASPALVGSFFTTEPPGKPSPCSAHSLIWPQQPFIPQLPRLWAMFLKLSSYYELSVPAFLTHSLSIFFNFWFEQKCNCPMRKGTLHTLSVRVVFSPLIHTSCSSGR